LLLDDFLSSSEEDDDAGLVVDVAEVDDAAAPRPGLACIAAIMACNLAIASAEEDEEDILQAECLYRRFCL